MTRILRLAALTIALGASATGTVITSCGNTRMFSVGLLPASSSFTETSATLNFPLGSVFAVGSGIGPYWIRRLILMRGPASDFNPPAIDTTSINVLPPRN